MLFNIDLIFFTYISIFFFFKLLKYKRKKVNFFIHNSYDFKISLVKFLLYVLIYVVFLRILRLFFSRVDYLDLNYYILILELFRYSLDGYFFKYLILMAIYIFLILFLLMKFIVFDFKISFLKLHYYYFLRFYFYEKIFLYLCNKSFFVKNTKFFFIRDHLFKFVLFYFYFKGFFLDDKIIYIGFVKYYVLYYFLLNSYKFFQKFNLDFDRGILQAYYPNFFCITNLGFEKLFIYKNSLVLNENKNYVFLESQLYYFNIKMPENFLFFDTFNHNNISYSNDVFVINKFRAPEYFRYNILKQK